MTAEPDAPAAPPDPARILRERFGFGGFRPGQKAVMSALWRQRAALAVFPTGGGKSLCYQLPALMFEGVTVVVSPLIALMKDQIDFLTARGIPAARLDSTLSGDEARDVMNRVRDGAIKLLYVAPERFNNERFLAALERLPIALFAVDEAHCISEWGHNFRPDYLKLAETARSVGAERILALTATATPSVARDICAAFGIPPECAIVTGFYRHNLRIRVTAADDSSRDSILEERIRERPPGSTIVYVTLQKTAERVARYLACAGFAAKPYHAGLDNEVRASVQEWWMASASATVVATIAFGMGIDKADVRYVYHYNLPKGLESYSQEIGRAGRDDKESIVELLACASDVPTLENFVYGDTPTRESIHALVAEMLASGRAAQDSAGDNPSLTDGQFAISQYELSARHDMRPLVLRTALTYLELLGVLRQGTPFYEGYEIRLLAAAPYIIGEFTGEAARLVEQIFHHADRGRILYRVLPGQVAAAIGTERRRIVRALEVLEERRFVTLRPSDARNRYTCLQPDADPDELTDELMGRFGRREAAEVARVEQVLELMRTPGCITNGIAAYFGEIREAPCGHCSYCETGLAAKIPPPRALPPIGTRIEAAELRSLRSAHPAALGLARQAARFLCGLSSPATGRAKLGQEPLSGALDHYRFADVLRWCEETG